MAYLDGCKYGSHFFSIVIYSELLIIIWISTCICSGILAHIDDQNRLAM